MHISFCILLTMTTYPIFLSGIPCAGKSTFIQRFKDHYIISLDNVIREELSPQFPNSNVKILYGIYHPENPNDSSTILQARVKFIEIIRNKINHNTRVVIEGTILNEQLIRGIFGNNDNFTFYFIKPQNKAIYKQRFIKRFVDNPDAYGEIGRLRKMDVDGSALLDYKKNGINGVKINELITTVMNRKYDEMDVWIKYYNEWKLDIKYIYN